MEVKDLNRPKVGEAYTFGDGLKMEVKNNKRYEL